MNKCFNSVKYVLIPVIFAFLFIPISSAYSQTAIYVVLQGSNRPDPQGWEVPLTVELFEPGADVLSDPNIYSLSLITYKSGSYAVCQVSGVLPDTYDIAVVSDHTLLNVKRDVAISYPTTVVDMGTLLEGDAGENHVIDLRDFAILASGWLSSGEEPDFDTRADFDRNYHIDSSDLSLLTTNWLEFAPIEVPWTTEIEAVCTGELCEQIEPEQEQAGFVLTGPSEIHLLSDFFSEFTRVTLYYEGREFNITEYCRIDQSPSGPKNHIGVRFDTRDLPIGPMTWALYTIQLTPMPPIPAGAKTSDDIWILTNGPELE